MPEPIEIRPEDIIKRPSEVIKESAVDTAKGKGGNFLSQLVEGIKQAKEIKKELEAMGIDFDSIFSPGSKKGIGLNPPPPGSSTGQPPADARDQNRPNPANQAVPTPAQQAKSLLRILQVRYGDISVNELIEKLKSQFGDKKISDFLKEF